MTVWAHLWVDHMWGIARECGTLSAFSAFRGRGKHQSLKSDIRKRSFKGGSKKRGSHLRGARCALRKGCPKVLRNDTLDCGLCAKGLSVWQPSWTRQEAYGIRGRCRVSNICKCTNQICCAYFADLVVEYHLDTCD